MRGFDESDNIFCTEGYSFENYLVTNIVLESILNDEFECSSEPEKVQDILKLYNSVSSSFCEAMTDANLRLFIAAKYNLHRERIENNLNKFVEITVNSVMKKYDSNQILSLIPLREEPVAEQTATAPEIFNKIIDPMKCHRGKYIYSFFLKWLDILAASRKAGSLPFSEPQNIRYNRASITDRSLASRSEIPNGLTAFILRIKELEAA
ncbi:MAG: DUF4435 domain-containing protein [Rickettsiales bacterium]|nr:DUF4435 domain-containing protein [Rickettsiales bacterium]